MAIGAAMSNIPTARDSAIEAAYQEAVRISKFTFGKRAFVEMVRANKELRESVDCIERAIESDRQYRIADAIMREVKPT